MVNSGNQRVLLCEGNFIFYSTGTVRSLFDSLWIQLKKFSFSTSWPLWLENRQSWIIKIVAEFITQVSLVLSERRLLEGQNHLFCDDKISGCRNWFIEVWMSADAGRVTVSRFSSDIEEQNKYYKKLWFFVLLIKWLAAKYIPFNSSNTTSSISATSCWALKSKVTPLATDSLRF